MDGYTDDQHQPNDSALDDEEPTLPTLPSRPQSSLQQGYSDLEPPPLSDDIDEDQAILSAMEAEKAGSGCKERVEEDTREVSRSNERYFVRVSRAKKRREARDTRRSI
jgi:hypothetical protein